MAHTKHPQPSDLVHEQRRDDVAWQHSQGTQETDKVDHVGIIFIAYVTEQAALFVVQESAVDELTVDQPVLEKICEEKEGIRSDVQDSRRGDRKSERFKELVSKLLSGGQSKTLY